MHEFWRISRTIVITSYKSINILSLTYVLDIRPLNFFWNTVAQEKIETVVNHEPLNLRSDLPKLILQKGPLKGSTGVLALLKVSLYVHELFNSLFQ